MVVSICLLPQEEYRWTGQNPSEKTFPKKKELYPLYHQWCTSNAEEPIIVNTHNTGTGKTKAALLRLLKRVEKKGRASLRPLSDDVLFIAPTNELIQQHVMDIRAFCAENELPYRVYPITRKDLQAYNAQPGFSEEPLRLGAAFHYILNDASRLDDDTEKRATIYVVNPDIFYYATYTCYNLFDRGALLNDFVRRFNYIVIDEFHYYTPKQFTAFLFFIKLSQQKGYIDSKSKRRQFCILTATPRPQVEQYLNALGLPIAWIKPGELRPEDEPYVEPVRALASVQLEIYSTEELKEEEHMGGLLKLIEMQRETISQWLTQERPLDGAIISSSLGAINHIKQALLPRVPADLIGRITGPQWREDRREAKEKRLILATPTVDIGYNFDRSTPKKRQNIDFLLFDAYAGDDFIQRLGRAARVLSKKREEQQWLSTVVAVVDPTSYDLLKSVDGMTLSRADLGKIALEMPRKNDLYAYVRTGAIIEIFRPIMSLQRGLADEEQGILDAFLQDFQRLFFGRDDVKVKSLSDWGTRKLIVRFDKGNKAYGQLRVIPQKAFELLPFLLERRTDADKLTKGDSLLEQCLDQFNLRLKDAWQKEIPAEEKADPRKVATWLQEDVRLYYREKARFSFRDGFQPPLALFCDDEKLLSDQVVNTYNVLHIVKYYEADYYETYEEWQRATKKSASDLDTRNVLVYCRLKSLRREPLRLSMELDARDFTQDAWEEQYAYQVTTLYGLKIVARNDHNGLDASVHDLLSTQFVPVFVAWDDTKSYTGSFIAGLRKKARFYPLHLEIVFARGKTVPYHAILGSMAFQVGAEIPYWMLVKDRRTTQRADEEPLIY